MPTVEFPDKLFDHVRTRSCVLCTGVRLSAAAGLPDWAALCDALQEKLEAEDEALEQQVADGKWLTVAGYLKRKLGEETCVEMIKEAYTTDEDPPELFKSLGEIPFHGAITTAYDTLLERALGQKGDGPSVYTHADGAMLRLNHHLENFVVKAHGDVERDAPLVFSLADFKQIIGTNKEYQAFVEELYRTQTLLLVGYHIDDPDLTLLLERLLATFPEPVTDHYAILPGVSELEAEELYANYRIRVISYEEDAEDPAGSLADVVGQFRDQWADKGEELPGPDDPSQHAQYIRQQLAPVDVRLDVMVREGLQLSDGRLNAIRDSAKDVDLDQLDVETLCRLGNVNIILGNVPQALLCYEAALDEDDKLAAAHLNLHHACAEAGKFDDSLKHLNQVRELDASLWAVPDRYEIKGVIGRGTSGTIYEAHDSEEDREVVVKLLRASHVREHISPEVWHQETETLTALEHDNLRQVYDAMLEGGRCIMITERLHGKNLTDLLGEKGPLSADVASEILDQVCQGLQHAHEQEILHLDITPSNIFVKKDGTAVLMDFRTGRAQKGRYVTVKKGSEGYQAPELLAGEGGDARADVYSLGAVLYTMITCKVPIGAFRKVAELNPAARRFDALVARSLRPTPDERPQTVQEFAAALTHSAEELVVPDSDDDLAGWLEVLAHQPDHEKALEVLDSVAQELRDEEQWDDVITLLLGRVEVTVEAADRERLLVEVADLYEQQEGDLTKAFPAMLAAFRENPTSDELRGEVERLAGATGMWNDLLQEYNNQVQALTDPARCCDLLVQMGHLYNRELKLADYAIASFNQVITRDPSRADALYELAELYRQKEEHKERAKVMAKLADLEQDQDKRIEKLRDLAQVYVGELDSDEQAILTYRKVLEIDEANAQAMAALEGLFRKAEMWEELAQLLKGRVELTEVAEDQRAFRLSLAQIMDQQLEQTDQAIEQYQAVLDADSVDLEALKGLEGLYEKANRTEEYLAILDRRIESSTDDDERVALCRRMAAECEEQDDGQARAAEYLERIVEVNGGDEETFKALVRIYWATGDHSMLAEAYTRQAAVTKVPADRSGLYSALAKVYEDHLEHQDKAIDAFNNLLSVEQDSKIALSGLARLYAKTEAWAQAVEMLEQLATTEEEIDAQADAFCRMGRLQHDKLDNAEQAEVNLVKALELKEDHVDAMLALAELYRSRKDYGKAARMLYESASATTNELERVARLYQSAVAYQEDLEDEDRAVEVFEELLGLDPEHLETGERLADVYEGREDWDKAEAMLEMLVRKADATDKEAYVALNHRLGGLSLKNEDHDRALTAFRAAYDIDPTNQLSLQSLASLLYEREQMEEAAKLFQALLVHRRDSMTPEQTVQVFYSLGDIKAGLGEQNKALNMFEKALDLDPTNPDVLGRAVELYEGKGDLEAVLRCKKKMLDKAEDDETRLMIAEEIGDLLHDQLKRPNDALKHYELAKEIKPDYRRVLHKIMEVYIGQRRWQDAVEAMGKIEDFETDQTHRSRLHYTAAVIYRDELKQIDEAADHFDQALVKDPSFRKAFDALKKLYTQQENWKKLAKAYHLMLQRLPEDTPATEQVGLWQELGEICQYKLKDAREAIVAYEVADKQDPTNEERQEKLAQLYAAAGPDAYDKAVQVNQRLLMNNAQRLGAYRELRRLYTEMKQYDKAWCVSAVLALLGKADDEEQVIYSQHRVEHPRRLSQKITDEMLDRYVYHPQQNRFINAVFSGVHSIVVPMAVRSAQSFGLRNEQVLEPSSDSRPYAEVAAYVGQVLGAAPDRMYVAGDLKAQLATVVTGSTESTSTALQVSPNVVKSVATRELTFWFAKQYLLLRPEQLMAVALPSATVLRAVLLAALKLVQPSTAISGDTDEINRLFKVLRRDLAPGRFDHLVKHVDALQAAASEQQVSQWLTAVDHSAARAALVLCDDLETAARLTSIEPADNGVAPKDRLQELITYAVSDKYFKLREHLGLAIG